MNILLIGNDFHSIYYTRKELITELVKYNRVYVAIPDNNKNYLIEQLGAQLITINLNRMGKNPFREILVINKINKITKKTKADIIFTFTIKPNLYTGLLQSPKTKKQIVTITGLGRLFQKDNIIKKILIYLYRKSFRNVKSIIFENKENESIFTKLRIANGRHILVNGAGVNLDENPLESYPEEKDVLRILFVGRIEKDKGFIELYRAAQHYEKKNERIEFIILGSCEKTFEKEFKKMCIPNNMKLEGWQMNVHKYLKLSHAVILPSYHEGMANVLLEAAATGRPILASRIHGCMESFEEGESGLGFEKGNLEDMIRVIDQFIKMSNDDRKLMGLKGRHKMEREFDRKNVVDKFVEQIY